MKLIDVFYEQLDFSKEVSKLKVTKKDVTNWLHTIDEVNKLDYLAKSLKEHMLKEYLIPQLFKCLIKPSRVSVGTDRRFKDLLNKDDKFSYTQGEGEILKPGKFVLIGEAMCKALKKDKTVAPVSEIRKEYLLTDVVGNIVKDGEMPIAYAKDLMPITIDTNVFEDYEWSVNEEVVVNEILHDILA